MIASVYSHGKMRRGRYGVRSMASSSVGIKKLQDVSCQLSELSENG